MFTGIVEEVGRLSAVARRGDIVVFSIKCKLVVEDLTIGDSVAVNGACLTAVAVRADGFDVELVPETLRRTNLGDRVAGDPINLERSLSAHGRFGGHVVQGHVDATGEVVEVSSDGVGGSLLIRVRTPGGVMRYVVPKGYVALDGMSLTVVDVDDLSDTFRIALIPHTLDHTVAGAYERGSIVNLEADILGKYVERLAAARLRPSDDEEEAP